MQIARMQCPVKTPGSPALSWILELPDQIFCCLCFSGLFIYLIFACSLRAVLSRGQPCQTHPTLVKFHVFLADAYGKAGIAHPKTPVGLAVMWARFRFVRGIISAGK